MFRRSFAFLAVTVLALTVVVIAADPASAQQRRGFSGGYYNPQTGFGFGYGDRYYGGGYGPGQNYYGYGPGEYSYGRRNYPENYWGGWNAPEYRWSGSEYSWNTPSYYGEGTQGDYYSSGAGMGFGMGGQSYGALSGGGMDNNVLLTVHVPPNAEVWVDDQKTNQTGNIRTFISPALNADKDFVYHIRARWTEDGRQVEKNRKLDVHAGDRFFVNFMKPRSESMGTPGQTGEEPRSPSGERSREQRGQSTDDRTSRENNADRVPQRGNESGTSNTQRPPTGEQPKNP